LDIVKYLVGKGADVNAKNNKGRTPLFNAVFYDLEVVKYLVKKGEDINAKNNVSKPPLDVAKNVAIIKFLHNEGGKFGKDIE
jgi:ankyrin repeat protein